MGQILIMPFFIDKVFVEHSNSFSYIFNMTTFLLEQHNYQLYHYPRTSKLKVSVICTFTEKKKKKPANLDL